MPKNPPPLPKSSLPLVIGALIVGLLIGYVLGALSQKPASPEKTLPPSSSQTGPDMSPDDATEMPGDEAEASSPSPSPQQGGISPDDATQ